MKRDLAGMAAKLYDIVVIGGGITGACVVRDAALRGLSAALVEKNDFASATTAASSKLIHGGLRYLQHLELGIVRESLRERRIWSNTAPHLVDPITFLMPTYRKGIKDRLVRTMGLRLYDWLSYDRNRLNDPEKAIPAHKSLSRDEAIALEPGLESDGLTGAMVFYDCQMYSPERLALECIFQAVESGADVANYAEVTRFVIEDDRVLGVVLRDRLAEVAGLRPGEDDRESHVIRARLVVNASGPWADLLSDRLKPEGGAHEKVEPAHATPHLIRSKGIHLITRAISNGHAIAVPSEHSHIFIIPWRGCSLLGTTDTVFKGDPDDIIVTEKDIVDFLSAINKGYPAARLRRSDVQYFYGGLRPLVDTTAAEEKSGETSDTYTASRSSEVYDHEAQQGFKGAITAIGGKWTTSRHLAEQVVDLAVTRLGLPAKPCVTEQTPTYGGAMGRFNEFRKQAVETHPDLPKETVEHLARNYGSRFEEILELVRQDPAFGERLDEDSPDIAAEVLHATRREMAFTVDDVLFRRTGLGTLGHPGFAVVNRVADLMTAEYGWTPAQRSAQVERAVARFVSWARTLAVVNPHSWGDRTGSVWPSVESKLRHIIGPIKAVYTDAPLAATRLTRQALKDGMQQIIAVGGDGTINEVVNGFFEEGRAINPEAVLAVFTSGTGGDFRRTFGLPDGVEAQIERLASSEIRAIDLGCLTFVGESGETEMRYFNNIASFGLSGTTDRAVNQLTYAKALGGKAAFQWGMLKALLAYRNESVRIRVDDGFDQVLRIKTAAVCNGQYFGGSMRIAPNAKPDDGFFDVVIIGDISNVELLRKSHMVYKGEHLQDPSVTVLTGRTIVAEPVDGARPVLLDVDGETPGRLPATFEMLPSALYFRS